MDENSSMDFYEKQVPKQKKGGSTFIIILLLLIIIGMGGYIAYDKGYLDNIIKKDTKTEQKQEENKSATTNELKEITDQNVIKTLDRNVDILNQTTLEVGIEKSKIFEKNQKNKDLADAVKINSVINYLVSDETKGALTVEEFKRSFAVIFGNDSEELKTVTQEFLDEETDENYGISALEVNKLFKSLYGYEPTINGKFGTCPERIYDNISKKYISFARCGGTGGDETLVYNYKYEEDEKNVYVYTALAVDTEKGLFTDYDCKVQYNGKITDENDTFNFELDKSNYEQFSKYKITFTKSGSDYVFDSIELLK